VLFVSCVCACDLFLFSQVTAARVAAARVVRVVVAMAATVAAVAEMGG